MQTTEILVTVTADRQLELPAEIQAHLHPGDQLLASITEAGIVLKQVKQNPAINLDEFFQRLNQAEPDPDQPTLEEISEMVKEVRRERRAKQGQQ